MEKKVISVIYICYGLNPKQNQIIDIILRVTKKKLWIKYASQTIRNNCVSYSLFYGYFYSVLVYVLNFILHVQDKDIYGLSFIFLLEQLH